MDLYEPDVFVPPDAQVYRLMTHWGTAVFADLARGMLRHGPKESSPMNVTVSERLGTAYLHHVASDGNRYAIGVAPSGASTQDAPLSQPATRSREFEVIPITTGDEQITFALRSTGLFLCAENDGRITLSRSAIGPWEAFRPAKNTGSTPDECIDVIITMDNNFTDAFLAAVLSIAGTTTGSFRLNVISTQDSDYRHRSVSLVEGLGIPYRLHAARDIDRFLEQRRGKQQSVGIDAHYLRLFAPDLFADLERAIYLDSDVIVRHDLRTMWDVDLAGYAVAAVADPAFLGTDEADFREAYGGSYFNSGVMLWDLSRWRADDTAADVFEWICRYQKEDNTGVYRHYWDQSPLNRAMKGKWLELSPLWNCTINTTLDRACAYGITKEEMRVILEDPSIYHFVGREKPWLPEFTCLNKFSLEYQRYSQLAKRLGSHLTTALAQSQAPVVVQTLDQEPADTSSTRDFEINPRNFVQVRLPDGAVDCLVRLKAAYRTHAGINVVSGLNPYHFGNYRDAPFTHYLRNGKNLTGDLGISLWELLVLERYCRAQPPRSIFIIGNGLGWSAIALAMMNPDAFVVAIDPQTGIELTNRIAFRERLNCIAVQGSSPADCTRIIGEYSPSPPDLVLVDGLHSNEQIATDFEAAFAVCGRAASYFFHDIINFNMIAGLSRISELGRTHAMNTHLLFCTPSGMAAVIRDDASQLVHDAITLFSVTATELTFMAKASSTAVNDVWQEHLYACASEFT
jgi:lipopolysaccharide biosynthesis glycosyltransferase